MSSEERTGDRCREVSCSPRRTTSESGCPALLSTSFVNCFLEEIFSPLMERIMSPSWIPAVCAGLTARLLQSVTAPVPTTITPSVTILMPKGVPHRATTRRSTTCTLTGLMLISPSSFKSIRKVFPVDE